MLIAVIVVIVLADIPNYTDLKPTMQISEVVVG
jgi:hypothetical protein